MKKDFFTLQEAGDILGKSTQTIRRMIKRGELKAQRVKTPQGFHYVIKNEDLGFYDIGKEAEDEMLLNSPIQNVDIIEEDATEEPAPIQAEMLINQHSVVVHEDEVSTAIDKIEQKTEFDMKKYMEDQHLEKMMLIKIIEKLQDELDKEQRKPRSLFAYIIDWLMG